MFKINDYVVYGTTGVCKIVDITKEKYLGVLKLNIMFYSLFLIARW